jgi:predicted transcriptional regulator
LAPEDGVVKEPSIDDLGSLQRAVLEVVWERGEATVHDVLARLPADRPLAYTSVLSTLQVLEKLGWVTHRTEGRTYVYRATKTRDEAGRRSLRKFVQRVFRGNRLLLFQHLLEEERLSPEELASLRRMIDQRRRELKEPPGGG